MCILQSLCVYYDLYGIKATLARMAIQPTLKKEKKCLRFLFQMRLDLEFIANDVFSKLMVNV